MGDGKSEEKLGQSVIRTGVSRLDSQALFHLVVYAIETLHRQQQFRQFWWPFSWPPFGQ